MAPKPKHSLDEKPVERGRPFVGREDLIKIFKKTVRSKFGKKQVGDPQPTVLVFHGVAGIGKTELRKKLVEELTREYEAAIWAVVDFYDPKNLIIENAVFRLRTSLKSNHKIAFPTFDLAYALYWKKSNPQLPLNKETFSLWGEAGLVSDVIALAGEIPLVGFIPKVGQVIARGGKPLKDWWKKRGSIALQMLPAMEPHEILEQLPVFLAEDISNHFEKYRPHLVIFLDTYEAIWAKERELAIRLSKDKWVRAFIERLPQGLFVITGREKLEWHKKEEENWEEYVVHKAVDRLSKGDAFDYLAGCGINNQKIRGVIFTASKGVPLYLSLSVDTFEKIKKNQKREPRPEDFGKTFYDIFESLIRNLNENETETLKVLSAARTWDRELFELLVDNFNTGYPLTKTKEFHTFSFIESEGVGWKMHELMQEHLQEYQDKELRDKTHQFLFKHYNARLQDADVRKITETHKTGLTEAFYHATNYKNPDDLYKWMIRAVDVFDKAAQWQILVPLYIHTIGILESAYGVEDSRVAHCLNNLAVLYDSQGRYEETEPLYKKAIEIDEKVLGEDHPDYATHLNNLAELYRVQGRYDDAEPLYKKVIKIAKKALGEDHPQYAIHLNNLAVLYDSQGRYDEAEPLYKQTIEIGKKTLGEEHPSIATRLNNLAELYRAQGRYDEAEARYKKAIEIDRKALGEDHPGYAIDLNNLALLYDAQGRYDEAEPLYQKALEIDKKALGEDHPDYAIDLNNLAELYRAQRRYEKAEPLFKKAMEIDRKGLGEDHPQYATHLNNLAGLYRAQGRYDEAEPLFKKALVIWEKSLPFGHPNILIVLGNMAIFYREWGKEAEARKYEKRAEEIRRKLEG